MKLSVLLRRQTKLRGSSLNAQSLHHGKLSVFSRCDSLTRLCRGYSLTRARHPKHSREVGSKQPSSSSASRTSSHSPSTSHIHTSPSTSSHSFPHTPHIPTLALTRPSHLSTLTPPPLPLPYRKNLIHKINKINKIRTTTIPAVTTRCWYILPNDPKRN